MKLPNESDPGATRPAPLPAQDARGSQSYSNGSEHAASSKGGHGPSSADSTTDASGGGLLQVLLGAAESLGGSAESLIEVYSDRARLAFKRALVRVVLGLGAAVCLVTLLCAAALAFVRGACGGLTELCGGRAWLGDLIGGALLLAIVAGGVAFYLRHSSRRELERLRSKYERIRSKYKPAPGGDSRAEDGSGVARSGGSMGDPLDRDLARGPR